MRAPIRIAACAMAILWGGTGCLFEERLAGASEIGNPKKVTVTGIVYEHEEYRALGARVRLVPADYAPAGPRAPESWAYAATADSEGVFAISGVAPGRYDLEAEQPQRDLRLLVRGIEVSESQADTGLDLKALPFLQAPAALRIPLADSLRRPGAFLYFEGTSRVKAVTAGAAPLLFDSLPAGRLPRLVYAAPGTPPIRTTLAEEANLRARDTVALNPYLSWEGYRRLHLNTTASGAGLPDTAIDFPLLLRLSGTHIDFSNFDAEGRDVRFSKPDGTPLAYEVESWDRAAQKASIWIRLDTLYGNAPDQIVFLHYGHPGAADASSGPSVFPPDRWAGVWHFAEEPGPAVPFRDATGAGADGSPRGTWSILNSTPGVAGQGLLLDGSDQSVVAPAGPDPRAGFTLSLMFRTTTKAGGGLLGFGETDTTGAAQPVPRLWMDDQGRVRFAAGAKDTLASPSSYNEAKWHHAAGVLSPAGMALFVDGVRVAFDPAPGPLPDLAGGLRLGSARFPAAWPGRPSSPFLRAQIDEARASRRAEDAASLQAAYANQRTDANLIHFSN